MTDNGKKDSNASTHSHIPRPTSDLMGIVTSSICLLHCVAPLFVLGFASGIVVSGVEHDDNAFHFMALSFAIVAMIWSLGFSNRSITNGVHWLAAVVGLSLLAIGAEYELATIPGSILLVGTHFNLMRKSTPHTHHH